MSNLEQLHKDLEVVETQLLKMRVAMAEAMADDEECIGEGCEEEDDEYEDDEYEDEDEGDEYDEEE